MRPLAVPVVIFVTCDDDHSDDDTVVVTARNGVMISRILDTHFR